MKVLHKQQQGFIAIIMAMVIMVLVSLIALGFAFLARNNQEQNQNRELSTQAYYAAESGVNDAVDYLKKQVAAGTPTADATSCGSGNPLSSNNYTTSIGSNNTSVGYTCVLFDTTPTSLEYTVEKNNSKVVQVRSGSGIIASITISWQDTDASHQTFATAIPSAFGLLPQDSNKMDAAVKASGNNFAENTGMIRATLIPGNAASLSRANLIGKSQTMFLYPNQGSGVGSQTYLTTTSPSDLNQGKIVKGNCDTAKSPKYCSVKITGLDSLALLSGGSDTWYVRLRSIYRSSSVTISAANAANVPTDLINEQAVIDSTGKANNVLRRIQVRIPLAASTNYPEFAVETAQSLCKRMLVNPTSVALDGVGITPSGSLSSEPSCNPLGLF